jgi:glycosyltransferase involved in cell wall biosynthesis
VTRAATALRRASGPGASFAGRIAGVAVPILVVRLVGAGPETAPLFLALAVTTLAMASLTSVVELQGVAELSRVDRSPTHATLVLTGVALGASAALLAAAAVVVGSWFSPLVADVRPFALPMLITVPLATGFAATLGIAVSNDDWFITAAASLARALVIIAALVALLPSRGIHVIPAVLVTAEAIRTTIVLLYRPVRGRVALLDARAYARRVMVQFPAGVLGGANPAIDRYVAAALGVGSLAILDLSEKAAGVVTLAFSQGVLPAMYARWARQTDSHNRALTISRTSRRTLGVGAGLALVAVPLIALAAPLVVGGSTDRYRQTLVVTTACYLLGVPPYLAGQVLVRLVMLEGRMKWLSYIAVLQVSLNVALDVFLGRAFGLPGIALATSAVAWMAYGLVLLLVRDIPRRTLPRTGRPGSLESVTFVIQSLEGYGGQRVVVDLISGLPPGIATTVVTLSEPKSNDLKLPGTASRINVPRRRRGPVGLVSTARTLSRVIDTHKPDAVLGIMTYANLVTLLAVRFSRHRPVVVVTEHNETSRTTRTARFGRVLLWLIRRTYPHADWIVGVSDAVTVDLVETLGLPPEKTSRIYNPVNIEDILRQRGPAPHPWLAEPRQSPTVVCVAALKPAKGHSVLLRALATKELAGYRVILVGGGPLHAELTAQAERLGVDDRVHFSGYQQNPFQFVQHSDALVLPAHYEGFGLVAVEAAALGIPVVASAVGGLRELVPGVVRGLSVPPDDPGALARAVASVCTDPPDAAEVTRLVQQFDPSSVASRYLDLIAKQLTRERNPGLVEGTSRG